MKSKKTFILLATIVLCCQHLLAQEVSKSLEKQGVSTTQQPVIQPEPLPMAINPANITDFYASYEMEKTLKISPYATKINWGSPYLVKWDGGGIRGISTDRSLYLGHSAGFDIGGSKGGLIMGVQRGYNPLTGQWEIMPMATPYLNIGGQKFGFDVGGMAYSLLREAAIRNGEGKGNPSSGIIPPPIDFKVGFDSSPEIPAWMEKQFDKQ